MLWQRLRKQLPDDAFLAANVALLALPSLLCALLCALTSALTPAHQTR